MLPDPPLPGSPASWMRYAKSDLAFAKSPLPEKGLYEMLCFHAQQAAKKGVKAVLVYCGVEFPKTHVLERLIDLLPAEITRTPELSQAVILTPYATISRYPGIIGEELTQQEYGRAVQLAEAVVAWAASVIEEKA